MSLAALLLPGPAALASVEIAEAAPGAVTSRVSVRSDGGQADGPSIGSAISADGRYVVFSSEAANLVPGDTNGVEDVFWRDRRTGQTRRVSVGPGGLQADARSGRELFAGTFDASISADGKLVAFSSSATNLVAGDTNGATDVFLRDVLAGVTRRASVGPGGRQGNGDSLEAAISADGLHVAFSSLASNLVPGDTNDMLDVFVRDRLARFTQRVSVGPGGSQGQDDIGEFFLSEVAISSDGSYAAFTSNADNLVAVDNNGSTDIFLRDRLRGVTTRVSVGAAGREGNSFSFTPAVSADGRFVAFTSSAFNLVTGDTNNIRDVFVRDRSLGTTRRVSIATGGQQGNNSSDGAAISADGALVAFVSSATNLVAGDGNGSVDVFLRDRVAGVTEIMSVGPAGRAGNSHSFAPALAGNGGHVSFDSLASNLIAGDTNGVADVFVR